MNKELSKEEILENWGIFDSNESFDNANEAMQQYADQEKKKEAIAFLEWMDLNYVLHFDYVYGVYYHKRDLLKDISECTIYTTEQLYEIYNQQK